MIIRITIHGKPPRKNARHKIVRHKGNGRGIMKNSAAFDDLVLKVEQAAVLANIRTIDTGMWSLECRSYWSTMRHLNDCSVPNGDHDASVTFVSDALQKARVIDDDMRFVKSWQTKHYDKFNPRIEVVMTKLKSTEVHEL